MTDAAWATILQSILGRERRSLLQFIGEAYPWTPPNGQDLLAQLKKMIQEEQEAAVELANFLRRRHITPANPGLYPLSFANLGFVSLDYVLPLLIDHERQAIAQLQRDRAAIGDPEARQQVQRILDLKERHLKKLTELSASTSKAAHV